MNKTLKNNKKWLFRSGCTSYNIPDHIVPNVVLMAPFVDDIELLCFEALDRSCYIDEKTIERLKDVKAEQDISYTIHCPTDFKAGSENILEQDKFIKAFLSIYELTSSLAPSGYVLHLEGITKESGKNEVSKWRKRVDWICEKLVSAVSQEDISLICLENLSYNPDIVEEIAGCYGFSFCIDVGHLWLNKYDWKKYCERNIERALILHAHGVNGAHDHLSLKKHEGNELNSFINSVLHEYTGVLTLEVFSHEDVFESLEILEQRWGN